jgi:hypothetical protein
MMKIVRPCNIAIDQARRAFCFAFSSMDSLCQCTDAMQAITRAPNLI